jgi:cytochrome c2
LPTNTPTLQPAASPTTAVALAVADTGATEEQVKRGLEVYRQLYCGLCHKLDAAGTAGTFGPPHNGMGITAAQRIQDPQYTGQATTAADFLHESIVDPKVFIVPGYEQTQHHMPVYNYLTEADVAALVQMLLQQK